MLIGFGQPAGIVPSVSGAAGINLAALIDGAPASIARISGGAGSASLRLDWAVPVPVRIVAALGLSCPAGTALTLSGRRVGDAGYTHALGGNATSQTVVQLVDGSRAAWFVIPMATPPLVGLQLQVGAAAFDVGELAVLQAVEVEAEPEWSVERVDPSQSERTLGGGLNTVQRRTYRRLKVALTPAHLAQAWGGGLDGSMDWDALVMQSAGDRRVAALVRWGREGAIDAAELHRQAVFGRGVAGAIGHLGANYYNTGWTFEEVPAV